MKFSLISDMHVDFPQPKTPYNLFEENIIVAGDTSNGLDGLRFLNKLRRKGFNVFACDGNHEHYSNVTQCRTNYETSARFREEFASTGLLESFPILLRNGWYNVENEKAWVHMMSDHSRSLIYPEDMRRLAREEARSIRQTLQEWQNLQYKGIIVTHTSPCEETLNPEYEGSITNEWYWNPYMRPLLEEFSEQILVWCHGHTHAAADKIVSNVRVVCNPRGYPGENPDWKPLTIAINT